MFGAQLGGGGFSSGARTTVIDARGAGRAVEVSGTNNWLSGVTVTGGRADVGAGALVPSGATLFLYNVIMTDNVATAEGGAVASAGGDLSVFQSLLTGNRAPSGGGIRVQPGGDLVVFNSTLSGNTATRRRRRRLLGGRVDGPVERDRGREHRAHRRRRPLGRHPGASATCGTRSSPDNAGGACGGAISQRNSWQANIADDASCAFAAGGGHAATTRASARCATTAARPTRTRSCAGSPAINAGGADLRDRHHGPARRATGRHLRHRRVRVRRHAPEPSCRRRSPARPSTSSRRSGTVKVKLAGQRRVLHAQGQPADPGRRPRSTRRKGRVTLCRRRPASRRRRGSTTGSSSSARRTAASRSRR